MILTTSIKQPCTTTEHNNKGYIFTLYLFMLLCVVGNCLLFYCSCTGNCENCCGINGLLRIANIDQNGKVDGNKILNALFVNGENKALVDVSIYRGNTEKDYNDAKKEFLNSIDTICKTHLSAYVEVGDTARYFIYCTDANSREDSYDNFYNGLFDESEATKIEILSCGNNITNMSCMFADCSSLTNIDLSEFNTKKVTNMSDMFANCHSLTNIKLSSFNTTNVTDMSYMFAYCGNLTELNLSSFNADTVKDISYMFNNCFKNKATLICKASTIQKITDNGDSCLIIPNEKKAEINDKLKGNLEKVYTCSVKRGRNEDNSQITAVEEYKQK